MYRIARVVAFGLLFGWLSILARPARADDAPPPTPLPTPLHLPPPLSTGLNPDPSPVDGALADLPDLAGPAEVAFGLPPLVAAPDFVAPAPLPEEAPDGTGGLAVPVRLQDPDSVECGVASLGMAFDFLAREDPAPTAPSTAALAGWMRERDVLYAFGTGVEELAWTAREHGYAGSYFFSDWSLERLQAELGER